MPYCSRYIKIQQDKELNLKPQERLLFPSNNCTKKDIKSYDKNKHAEHVNVFDGPQFQGNKSSEMKTHFVYSTNRLIKEKNGIRRDMVKKLLHRKMAREVYEEIGNKSTIEDYCSEYKSHYSKFCGVNNITSTLDATENYGRRYPLYGNGSSSITLYTKLLNMGDKKNDLQPFAKSTIFTKPIDEHMESGASVNSHLHTNKTPV